MATHYIETAPRTGARHAARIDNRPSDVRLDQYYTRPDIAAHLYAVFREYFDPKGLLMVEPSAGTGSFCRLLPFGSLAFDVEPKYRGIQTADFLTMHIQSDRPLGIIGNPPFGKNASMAVRFFNHAAWQSNVIALILPRSFRKGSIVNRLDRAFHLLHEKEVPANAFLFRSKPYNVPALFQIWERRPEQRDLLPTDTRHPDFKFSKPQDADFAIQRVGARAGLVHHKFTASPKSHYFIKGDVEAQMRQLDFASVVGNTAGNPSLAKAEIVALYQDWIDASSKIHAI